MKYIASLSGGQDSTAMVVRLLELGEPLDYIIFCDTGNEFEEMYDYLDRLDVYLQNKFGMTITRLSAKKTLKELCFSPFTKGKRKGQLRGLPYASSMSFCTRELKKNISDRFCKSLNDDCVMYLGYVAREKSRQYDNINKYISHKYPLCSWNWNEPEVSAYLKEKTLFNNLYNYYTRTGCKFCPKQSLDSWYALYVNFPKDWNEAKDWELQAFLNNAHIKNFRSDYSLIQLEKIFEKRLQRDKSIPQFQFNWNDENVSCMCK